MKLADVSINRPVLATVMVGTLLVFGIVAYPRIGVDLFPDVEFPIATVTAVYPGADPETVETKVIDKLEEAISSVDGIKVLRSSSLENVGQVVVQFELERVASEAVQDVRDKVSGVLAELPPDLEPPVVAKFDVGAAPILALVVSGDRSIRDLTKYADDVVKQRLQTIQGVGGVELVGGREREFHVWVNPRKLDAHGLAVQDVIQSLASQNVEIPGGRLNIGTRELVIKTRGQVHNATELGNIIVTAAGGSPVRIRDIARVEDGEEEPRTYSSLDGVAAVSLVVRKQSGANTIEVADGVYKAVEELRQRAPEGTRIAIPLDNSPYIRKAIGDVQFDLMFGAILAVIIILFFLHDWRATLISALAIPTSVVATFAFIGAMGFTFNNTTMLALTISIGILVDDAIVVIEAIHRHVAMGKPALRAASDACNEIGLAVVATTATLAAVFIPVAFMKGLIGRFFLQFGLTVAFAVTISLFVAFTVTPMLSSRTLVKHHTKGPIASWLSMLLDRLDAVYRQLLAGALKHRALTLTVAGVTFIGSCALLTMVPTEFLPPEDRGEFNVKLEMPTGTDLSATRTRVEKLGQVLRKLPGVTGTFARIGAGNTGEVNKAEVLTSLVKRSERDFDQEQAMAHVRAVLAAEFPGMQSTVDPVDDMGGGSGFRTALVQFNVRGNQYEEINAAVSKLIGFMRKQGGYVDLDQTYRGGKPEVAVRIDRDRAADLNVPIVTIASTLQSLVAGRKATELTTDGDRYDVRVRLEDTDRQSIEGLLSLKVRSNLGQMVPLSNLVTLAEGTGPALIERQNRQRQVTVLANLEGKTLGQAMDEVNKVVPKLVKAPLVSDWTGMGDIMKESFYHLVVALIFAFVMVYLILAAQFESFFHPLTIIMSVPLSAVGALGALALTGMSLNIFSMIGMIMLIGIVTKNAILLVDYTNQLREKGQEVFAALLEAGPVRLRPILMTSAATIAGMIPVALGQSEGGEQRAPMALCVIGGLTTSTLLTLVVVPVVYSLVDGIAARMSKRFRRISEEVVVEPATVDDEA